MADRDSETPHSEQPTAAGSAATDGPSQGSLQDQLEAARAESELRGKAASEFKGLLQRVQADFVNYKRRTDAEREQRAEAVRAETILAFLPVVDDLERALGHLPADVAQESWAQGFRLIERNVNAVFERLGVKPLGAEGEAFDPNVHEAVAYVEHPKHPEGHVTAVARKGYQLGERVIRPAQVAVARPGEGQGGHWPPHQAPRAGINGGAAPDDVQRPRTIDRS